MFNRWKDLARTVQKGKRESPFACPLHANASRPTKPETRSRPVQFFVIKNNWFVLAQTEGKDYTPEPPPEWNETRALDVLNITKVPFASMNGNAQAMPPRTAKLA